MEKSLQVSQWLLSRGLSQEVIDASGIHWNGSKIVIPVKDINGKVIFNKYRKDPFSTDENIPKYIYEAGSTAALYNVHTLVGKHKEKVFIVEGELDALLLNSFGLNAVSSTGGSQTFHPGWFLDFLNNDVYITYDKDDAGIKGALRVNAMLTSAKIIFLPHDTRGKDVTDFFATHTILQFLALAEHASSWVIPMDAPEIPKKKTGIDLIVKEIKNEMSSLLLRQQELNRDGKSVRHVEIMIEVLVKRVENWRKIQKQWGVKKDEKHLDDISRAKQVPISHFVKFNGAGFALCLWHDESSPSMKNRPERGKVFCHGCSAHKDVLDVVMAQNNCSFSEALKIILKS